MKAYFLLNYNRNSARQPLQNYLLDSMLIRGKGYTCSHHTETYFSMHRVICNHKNGRKKPLQQTKASSCSSLPENSGRQLER